MTAPSEVLVDDDDVRVLRRHRWEQLHVAVLRTVHVHRGRSQGPQAVHKKGIKND